MVGAALVGNSTLVGKGIAHWVAKLSAHVTVRSHKVAHLPAGTLEALLRTIIGKGVTGNVAGGIFDGENHIQFNALCQHVKRLAHEGAREVIQLRRDALSVLLSTHEASLLPALSLTHMVAVPAHGMVVLSSPPPFFIGFCETDVAAKSRIHRYR